MVERKCQLYRMLLAVLAICGTAAHGNAEMRVSFDERNVLRGIQIGEATFATGGGDLWTAEFSDGTNRAKPCADTSKKVWKQLLLDVVDWVI